MERGRRGSVVEDGERRGSIVGRGGGGGGWGGEQRMEASENPGVRRGG